MQSILIAISFSLAYMAASQQACGNVGYTCFDFLPNVPTMRMIQEERINFRRAKYFRAHYQVISFQVDSEDVVDFGEASCSQSTRIKNDDFIEQSNICVRQDTEVVMRGR
eukprot:Platyproteum_vivax@DN2176_c0_g1_i1.p1